MSILLLFYQSFKSSIFYTFYYKQQTLKVFSWRDKDPPKVETTALLCMLVIVANSLYKTISILIFKKPKLNLCFGIFLKKNKYILVFRKTNLSYHLISHVSCLCSILLMTQMLWVFCISK